MPSTTAPAPLDCSVQVGSHRIAVIDGRAGRTGPPLVFVHGIVLSARLWSVLVKGTPLDDYPWISLGLPGHFPSEAPADFTREDVTVELFADCVTTPVRVLFGEQPVHLIGWSTGGFACLAAAARQPALAASVVSISGFARGRWRSHLGFMQFLARRWLGRGLLTFGLTIYRHVPRFFRGYMQALAKQKLELSDELLAVLFEDFGQHDLRAMITLIAGIRDLDLTESLADVLAPVLILGGAADKVIRSEEAQHLHELLPDAQLIEIPDVGHVFFGEAAAENLAQIQKWVETR